MAQDGAAAQGSQGRSGGFLKILAVLVVVLIAVIVIYLFFAGSGSSVPQQQNANIYSNATNSNLTSGQMLFYKDLARVSNLSGMVVSFSLQPEATFQTMPYGNATLDVVSQQNVTSYLLGQSVRTSYLNNVEYVGSANGSVISRNFTGIYYYSNSNNTVVCQNLTTYVGGRANSSFGCLKGNGGLQGIVDFPFTLNNLTAVGYLGQSNITYEGTRSVAGRSCQSFLSSGLGSNLFGNYSIVSVCLDGQYGIPLYYNETDYSGGTAYQGPYFLAESVSTNVSPSELAIPGAYLNDSSSSMI